MIYGTSSQFTVISDGGVATEKRIISDGIVVAHGDIVTEVSAGSEVVMVAEGGILIEGRAAVDGDEFTQGVSIANEDAGRGEGVEREVLRVTPHDRTGPDEALATDGDLVEDLDV